MKYIVFGAGNDAKLAVSNIIIKWKQEPAYLVDNFHFGFEYEAYGKKYPVFFSAKILEECKDDITIVISSQRFHEQIARQLRDMGFMEGKHFFGWPDFIRQHWKEDGALESFYELRVHYMSELIAGDSRSVLDLGCGEMHLKKYIGSNTSYFPCDYIKRDESTLICDLNKGEYPNVRTDTVIMSGIIEYISQYEWLFQTACSYVDKEVIIAYAAVDYIPNYPLRCKWGFANHLSVMQIVELFGRYGMTLVFSNCMTYPTNSILKFEKNNHTKNENAKALGK